MINMTQRFDISKTARTQSVKLLVEPLPTGAIQTYSLETFLLSVKLAVTYNS